MQTVQFREHQNQDRQANSDLWAQAFREGKQIAENESIDDDAKVYVGESAGKIVCVFKVWEMELTFHGKTIPAGGLASVAVSPEARHLGVGGQLVRWSLNRLRNEGKLFSCLYAFRESYYRKFGFECCGSLIRIECPNHRMPRIEPKMPVRLVKPKEWKSLVQSYNKFAMRYNGMNIRTYTRWERTLGIEHDRAFVYAVGDPIEGFVCMNQIAKIFEDQKAEICWTSPESYNEVISVLSGIGINRKLMKWYEPGDSPFLQAYADSDTNIQNLLPAMYRVLNVSKLLETMESEKEGKFSIEITDPDIPENCGAFDVSFGEKTVVSKTETTEIKMNVNRFAQAALGEPSLEELHQNGFVKASIDSIKTAKQLMPSRRVFLADFF